MGHLSSAIQQYFSFGFGKKKEQSPDWIAQYSLLQNMSYRLDASAPNDRWIGLREWYRHVIKTNGRQSFYQTISAVKEGHALITWDFNKDPKALEYVQHFHERKVTHFVGKDLISLQHLEYNALEKGLLHLFCLWLTLACFCFKKQRANRALLIRQSIEMACLVQWFQKDNIQHVSFFHPYEIDSNVLSIALQRLGITTTFVPSVVPLFVHNHHLVCDELVVTSPYQEEEIAQSFASSIQFKKLLRWPAETLFDVPTERANGPNKRIAFYSHGQWLRNALDRADNGLFAEDSEMQVLQWLKKGADQKLWEVVIYLHPLEKKHIKKTEDYYQRFFGSAAFAWGNRTKSSAHFFHQESFGIGTLSTVIFERLLAGHKTLLHRNLEDGFPIAKSTLNNISFHSWNELENFWNQFGTKDNDYFFETLSLRDYPNYAEVVKNA
jgi:hypothetical protein